MDDQMNIFAPAKSTYRKVWTNKNIELHSQTINQSFNIISQIKSEKGHFASETVLSSDPLSVGPVFPSLFL